MVNNIFVIRHSNRKDKDKDEKNEWLSSNRFKINKKDSPLSKFGIENCKNIANNLMKHTDVTKIKYFYSSPISRCVQTSFYVIDEINLKLGHKILLRIEYGLTDIDDQPYVETFSFNGNKIQSEPVKPPFGWKTLIDKELYPTKLKKKYGKYLDPNYNMNKDSIINYKNVKKEPTIVQIRRNIKIFNKLKNKNTCLITHGFNCYIIYQYVLQKKSKQDILYNKFVGSKNVGVTTGYQNNSKKIKIIEKPTNKFMNKIID